jgi:hypothetical protein
VVRGVIGRASQKLHSGDGRPRPTKKGVVAAGEKRVAQTGTRLSHVVFFSRPFFFCACSQASSSLPASHPYYRRTVQHPYCRCTVQHPDYRCTVQHPDYRCTVQHPDYRCTVQHPYYKCIVQHRHFTLSPESRLAAARAGAPGRLIGTRTSRD